MSTAHLQTARLNGSTIEFAIYGRGEPVLLIHGALAEAYYPLYDQPALTERYQLISYSRRGWGGSERVGTINIPAHADDCAALLDNLGIERAHIVGHSYGPLIALELALKHADRVHSLVLLETALPSVLLNSPEVGAVAEQTYAAYQNGDVAGAFDTFFGAFLGPDFRTLIERSLPAGAIERGIKDMPTLLENDFPALQTWSFGPEEAARIAQPTLLVRGAETLPLFEETHRQMQQLLPTAETFILPGATHAQMMMNATDTAAGLTSFFARHALQVYA